MEIFLILFGLMAIASGNQGMKRGRGGKMTRNGFTSSLIGYLCVLGGVKALIGSAGVVVLGVLVVGFWIGRDTGINQKIVNRIRNELNKN